MASKKRDERIEERLGAAIGRTAGMVFRVPLELLEQGAQTVGLLHHKVTVRPGAMPGIDLDADVKPPPASEQPQVTVTDYDADGYDIRKIDDLDALLAESDTDTAANAGNGGWIWDGVCYGTERTGPDKGL
jgi:hypothetical protein